MTDEMPVGPAGEVLRGLDLQPLPGGAAPTAAFVLVKYRDADGDEAFAVRVAGELDDDELLGTLVGYVEHLKRVAADGWQDHDTTHS